MTWQLIVALFGCFRLAKQMGVPKDTALKVMEEMLDSSELSDSAEFKVWLTNTAVLIAGAVYQTEPELLADIKATLGRMLSDGVPPNAIVNRIRDAHKKAGQLFPDGSSEYAYQEILSMLTEQITSYQPNEKQTQ